MVLLEIWVGVSPPSLSSIGSEVMLIAQVLVIAVCLVYATRGGCVNVVLWRMRSAPVKTALSFEQFLEFESSSLERHEFVNGNIHVYGEAGIAHNDVVRIEHVLHGLQRVLAVFELQVVRPTELLVFVAGELTAVFMVLSSMAELLARGEKWQNYQTIPSLEQYVLLSQSEPLAEVYTRQADGSRRYQSFSGAAIISFPSISFELSLKTLYADLPVN